MKIGKVEIAKDLPCKIIAEIGTLHHHQGVDGLLLATRDAFNAGADIVKTQLIDPTHAWWSTPAQRSRYYRLIEKFPREHWDKYLYKANNELGPTFASVFDGETIDQTKDVMPAVKIAYLARTRTDLVNSAKRALKGKIIISYSDDQDSQGMIDRSHNYSGKNLYVQSAYPLEEDQCRLPLFGTTYHGLSIHSSNFQIFAGALSLGAELLEVHVQGTDAQGKDTEFALDMEQLNKLVILRDLLSRHLLGGSTLNELKSLTNRLAC